MQQTFFFMSMAHTCTDNHIYVLGFFWEELCRQEIVKTNGSILQQQLNEIR